MKKIFTLLLIGILISSCSNNEEEDSINCSLFDPAFPDLYIRLVDETGTNLIETGTFDPENITVEGNFSNPGFQYVQPNDFTIPDADVTKYDHTLNLNLPYESKFEYTIHLDTTTSIILEFDATLAELPCDVSYYYTTKLTYKNQNVESENADDNELIFLAEIEI